MDSCIMDKLIVFPSSPGSAVISQHTPLGQKVFSMLKLSASCVFKFKKCLRKSQRVYSGMKE